MVTLYRYITEHRLFVFKSNVFSVFIKLFRASHCLPVSFPLCLTIHYIAATLVKKESRIDI